MKNTLILSGVYDAFLIRKKELYLNQQDSKNKNNYLDLIPELEQIEECFKIYNANHQRKYNNWNEICKWCFAIQELQTFKSFKLVFGTLTFKSKVLEKTCERTRARYVTSFLSSQAFHYVANIDYGKKNGREHYHFLAMIEKNMDMTKWNYGSNKIEIVPMIKKDIKATKNYLLKLNNHSYKNSTRQKRIIRDRNENKIIDLYCNKYAINSFRKYKLEMSLYEA